MPCLHAGPSAELSGRTQTPAARCRLPPGSPVPEPPAHPLSEPAQEETPQPTLDPRPPPHPVPALGLYPAGLPLLPIPLAPACSGRTAGRGDDCPSTVIRRCSCHSASVSTHPAASSNRREGWEEGRPIGRELSLPCPPAVEVAVMAGRWGLWSSRIAARNNVTLQTF